MKLEGDSRKKPMLCTGNVRVNNVVKYVGCFVRFQRNKWPEYKLEGCDGYGDPLKSFQSSDNYLYTSSGFSGFIQLLFHIQLRNIPSKLVSNPNRWDRISQSQHLKIVVEKKRFKETKNNSGNGKFLVATTTLN